jgi:hypothetical protein
MIDSGVVSGAGHQAGGAGPSQADGRWFITFF